MNTRIGSCQILAICLGLLALGPASGAAPAQPQAAAANPAAASMAPGWEAQIMAGTFPVDQETQVRLTIANGTVRAEGERGLVLSIPISALGSSDYETRTRCRGCSLPAAADGNIGGALMAGAIASLIPKAKEDYVDLSWEEDGVRSGVLFRFKKGAGAAFAEELKRMALTVPPAPAADSAPGKAAETGTEPAPGGANEAPAAGKGVEPAEPPRQLELVKLAPPLESPLPGDREYGVTEVYASQGGGQLFLEPGGKLLYRLTRSTFELVDWQQQKVVKTRTLQDFPCKREWPVFDRVLPVPGGDVVVRHCGTVYVLDKATLDTKRALAIGGRWFYRDLSPAADALLSPDGRFVAVKIDNALQRQFLVFDTQRWQIKSHLPLHTHIPYIRESVSFNSDGPLLIVCESAQYGDPQQVLVYRVDSGEMVSRFWLKGRAYFRGPVAGHSGLIAAVYPGDEKQKYQIALIDVESGDALQYLPFAEKVSRQGKWGISSHSVVDPVSGKVLCELPKKSKSVQDVSDEGGYLLTDDGVLFQITAKR